MWIFQTIFKNLAGVKLLTYVIWNGMEWNGMEWNGMEWNGMEWNGMEPERYTCLPARASPANLYSATEF
jgi:hypothetical protein